MTGNAASGIPEEWRQVARKDWGRLQRGLRDGDAEAGWHLRKIHVLHELLTDAVKHQAGLEAFRPLCERVSGYYVIDRYPPLAPSGLTCDEVAQDREQARRLIRLMFPAEALE